ncbi:hypothetical protein QYF49_05660 [Fictibacillus sp. CENA-BCM004]|uniref:Uncharacterized protein n=1 Tax=Fictibacillus terranigra TaxID=3058424 RepID=A0ABT8E3M3_9BACL|nr:hypothetical protein [Fictibacillus sp. CENA-BCM004]MDN4072516.1 hypothetical protein [Fictibacillus sp. CENA-BCM004]
MRQSLNTGSRIGANRKTGSTLRNGTRRVQPVFLTLLFKRVRTVESLNRWPRFMFNFLDGAAISAISVTHDLMRTGKQMDLFEPTLKMMLNVQKPDLLKG